MGLTVITGATGNVGKGIADQLLQQKRPVRVVGRDAHKLKVFTDRGAEPATGTLDDASFVGKALSGAQAVFAMIPPNLGVPDYRAYCRQIIDSYVKAIQTSEITHVVALSSIGAHMAAGAGPVNALHEMEDKFSALKSHVLFLRPGYFMENSFSAIGMIKGMGINGSPLKPDVQIPMIDTKDIAMVAAKRLAALDFTGKQVLELHGPRDYSMAEVTRSLGNAIGKPELPYVQFPYEDAQQAMVGMGLSADIAKHFIEMQRGFNEGKIAPTQKRSPATTTPTTIEEFSRTFAQAFKGEAPQKTSASGRATV